VRLVPTPRRDPRQNEALRDREAELRTRLSQRGGEWERRLAGLPDDPRLQVAALATLLELDAADALRPEMPISTLDDRARELRRVRDQVDRELRRHVERERPV
jgi:hypothetical protein